MKKKITYRLVWGVLIACLGLSDLAWCAEKKDSADQALQQLRLLQKRLGTSSSGEGASAEAGAG